MLVLKNRAISPQRAWTSPRNEQWIQRSDVLTFESGIIRTLL